MPILKRILKVVGPRGHHWVGDGFPVRQMFGYNDLGRELSPFLLLDYAGPRQFEPTKEKRGVGAHPHRGFETVTIVYSGGVEHRDSVGNWGEIGPSDVQWMTAGCGVLHEEMHSQRFREVGGLFELVQLWVNLPAHHKMSEPKYQTLTKLDIPVVDLSESSGFLRVIAGEFLGQKGPAATFTPVNIWDVSIKSGHKVHLGVPSGHTAAIFCMAGRMSICDKASIEGPQMVICERDGDTVMVEAESDSKLLFLGGEPIHEPMVGLGPFVMNNKDELEKAFKDYEAGLFGSLI